MWNNLNKDNKNKIKQFNSNLRKKRKSIEHQSKEEPTVSTRRNNQASANNGYEYPNKKQKLITFNNEEVQDKDEVQETRDEVWELNSKKGILKFNVKSSNKN